MSSDTYLCTAVLCNRMGSNGDDKPDGDTQVYNDFVCRSKVGITAFDAYVEILSHQMQIYDGIDPYERDALGELTGKADQFLIKHAGMSYDDFLRQAKPERFTSSEFAKLPVNKNLRRRIFEHRAMLLLSALYDFEASGYDVDQVMEELELETIPLIKPDKDEATFQEILKVLGKKT